MDAVLLDTGYLLALELANDQNHQVAKAHWERVSKWRLRLVTTSYVFAKVVTFLNSRGHHTKALQVGNNLLHSPSVHLVHISEALFYKGWSYFERHQDKSYSLTDCISFILMPKFGITRALTFDQHFSQAGFIREPQSV